MATYRGARHGWPQVMKRFIDILVSAALILLLHEWMKWWQAFAIGGVVAIACGVVAYSVIKRPAVTETKTV